MFDNRACRGIRAKHAQVATVIIQHLSLPPPLQHVSLELIGNVPEADETYLLPLFSNISRTASAKDDPAADLASIHPSVQTTSWWWLGGRKRLSGVDQNFDTEKVITFLIQINLSKF